MFLYYLTLILDSWPVLPSATWSYSDKYFDQWNQIAFDSSSWERSSRDGFPDIVSSVTTRYYRLTAAVPKSLSHFSGYRFGVYLRFGVIVHINGVEQFRINMPEGTITSYTPPIYFEETHLIHSYFFRTAHSPQSLSVHQRRASSSDVVRCVRRSAPPHRPCPRKRRILRFFLSASRWFGFDSRLIDRERQRACV